MFDEKVFLNRMEEILEMDENTLAMEADLNNMEDWSSLAIMGFVAMVDEYYEIEITTDDLSQCQTVADVTALVQKTISQEN